MKSRRSLSFFTATLLAAFSAIAARAQTEPQPPKQDDSGQPATQLKLIHSPTAPYPDEAQRKNVEGKVTLSIVVDATGRVSDAKVLSGPPELVEAAIQSVKQWEFEPPAHPPTASTTEVSYGHPRECPGPVSEAGVKLKQADGLEAKKAQSLAGTMLLISLYRLTSPRTEKLASRERWFSALLSIYKAK